MNKYRIGGYSQRPWGSWSIIDLGCEFAVKRITVRSLARLSLQRHRSRQEFWIVVSGVALASKGPDPKAIEMIKLSVGQTLFIPTMTYHRLENPGPSELIVIEVQTGKDLDEEDIERVEDDYGRI